MSRFDWIFETQFWRQKKLEMTTELIRSKFLSKKNRMFGKPKILNYICQQHRKITFRLAVRVQKLHRICSGIAGSDWMGGSECANILICITWIHIYKRYLANYIFYFNKFCIDIDAKQLPCVEDSSQQLQSATNLKVTVDLT